MQSSCLWKQLRYLVFEVWKITYALRTTVLFEVSELANILEISRLLYELFSTLSTKILTRPEKTASMQ